jgi:hypothetical protein
VNITAPNVVVSGNVKCHLIAPPITIGNDNGSVLNVVGVNITTDPNFSGTKILNDKQVMNCSANNIYNIAQTKVMTMAPNITLAGDTITLQGNIQSAGKLTRKSPIFFTTNRTFSMDGRSFNAYDIDLSLYTSKVFLDGYDHRHFRVRIFFANGRLDYQWTPNIYNIFMTTYNYLTIRALSSLFPDVGLAPFHSVFLFFSGNVLVLLPFFLVPVCFPNHMKVYFIFEDLL